MVTVSAMNLKFWVVKMQRLAITQLTLRMMMGRVFLRKQVLIAQVTV